MPYFVEVYERLESGERGALLERHGPGAKPEGASRQARQLAGDAERDGRSVMVVISEE